MIMLVLDQPIEIRPSTWLPAYGDPERLREAASVRARRRREREAQEAVRPPHPAPEVSCRGARLDEASANARKLALDAMAAGWVVSLTYARGTVMHKTGKPGAVVDSIALRMSRGSTRAVAIYHDGRAEVAYFREHGQFARTINVTELQTLL